MHSYIKKQKKKNQQQKSKKKGGGGIASGSATGHRLIVELFQNNYNI